MAIDNIAIRFNRYKPKQTYTFEVDIEGTGRNVITPEERKQISYAVSSVSIPKVQIQTIQDAEMGFGLFRKTIPIHDLSSKELTITFEETDDMLITNTFASSIEYSNNYFDLWNRTDFTITVKYYNEYKLDTKTGLPVCIEEKYNAIVKDFQHPQWNRNANVDKLDVTVTFMVMLKNDLEQYKRQIRGRLSYIQTKNLSLTEEEYKSALYDSDNDNPENNKNFWKSLPDIMNNIFKLYEKWLTDNNKTRSIGSAQEFLTTTKQSSVLSGGSDKAIINGNTAGMCGRGSALQVALGTNDTSYKGTGMGNGKDYANNLIGAKKAKKIGTKTYENPESSKDVEKEIANIIKNNNSKDLVISITYEDEKAPGHAVVVASGNTKGMSDFNQKNIVPNKKIKGYTVATIN